MPRYAAPHGRPSRSRGAAVFVVGGTIVRQFLAQPAASLSDLWVRLARTAATGLPSHHPLAVRRHAASAGGPGRRRVPDRAGRRRSRCWRPRRCGCCRARTPSNSPRARRSRQETGDASARRSAPRARAAGWTLPLTGPAEGIFVWKNGMQMLRASDATVLRMALPISAAVIGLSFAVLAANRLRGAAGVVTSFSLAVSAFGVLFGPQLMRLDLRGDLQHLDVLKTWPVRAGSVIRGEILWPAGVVVATVWVGVACAALFAGTAFPRLSETWRWVLAVSGIVAAPALVTPQYIVHNAVAHLFSRVGAGRDAAAARRRCDGAAPHHDGRRGLFAAAFRAARRDRRRHRVVRLEPAARPGRAGAGDRLLHAGRVDRSRARDRMARAGVRTAGFVGSGTRGSKGPQGPQGPQRSEVVARTTRSPGCA